MEVGKPLYELEVDENASASTPAASAPVNTNTAAAPAEATAAPHDHSRQRKPLIRFLGKRSLLPATSHAAPAQNAEVVTKPTSAPTIAWPAPKKPQTGVDFYNLKDSAFYGRPKLSEKEILAIESGGAY